MTKVVQIVSRIRFPASDTHSGANQLPDRRHLNKGIYKLRLDLGLGSNMLCCPDLRGNRRRYKRRKQSAKTRGRRSQPLEGVSFSDILSAWEDNAAVTAAASAP